jgi:hypothetical protein
MVRTRSASSSSMTSFLSADIAQRHHAAVPQPLALGGADLVADAFDGDIALELAKESSTLRVSRPMEVVVLNCWVTDTKETPWALNSSSSLAKSANERVSRSTL